MNCPRCHAPIPADGPAGMCPKCLLSVGLGEPEVVLTAAGEPAPPPPTPAELQPHFPQFEILRLVGRGGMGAVYEARQKGLARSVALKILAAPTRADASFEERFVREAQALARLSHENIVAVYDAGRAGPHFFLAMEYVDGPNLRQAERAGHIEPAQALALVVQICAALDYAHKNGFVHRDIKPENVLLTREGKVKIVDFGLAKVLDRAARGLSLTRMSQTMGTPHYMAPEQIEHPKDVDHRADIYSLGVVFYELLTGELPLGRFPLPSQKVTIDVRLDDIVIRTLEKEPDRRYQFAGEVRTAVQGVASSPMQSAHPTSVAAVPATSRARSTATVVALVVLSVLLLSVAAILVLLVWGTGRAEVQQTATVPSPEAPVPPAEAPDARMPPLPPDLAQVQERVERVVRQLGVTSPAAPRAVVLQAIANDFTNATNDVERLRAVDAVLGLVPATDPSDALLRYREHEAARTTNLPLANDRQLAAVRIEPKQELVLALRDDLRRELRDRLGPLALSAQHVEWLVHEHMPFDAGPIEVRVSRDGPRWIVESLSAANQRSVESFDELPTRYKRILWVFRANSFPVEPISAALVPGAPLAPGAVMVPQIDVADRALGVGHATMQPGGATYRYLEHEARQMDALPLSTSDEVAAVTLTPDTDLVHQLRGEFAREVRAADPNLTPGEAKMLIETRMPFDVGPVTVRIERDGKRWRMKTNYGTASATREVGDLPQTYRRILARYGELASRSR